MTSNDELERQKFDAWYLEIFDIQIAELPKESIAVVIYSSLWQGWLARSKQEAQ